MSKTILVAAMAILFAGTSFTSCDSPKDNVIDAQEKVETANENLDKATDDYIADIENFRNASNLTIEENNKVIASLKAGVSGKEASVKSDYWKEIAELEKKNAELKARMASYKADGKENWESFKTEFNHDMQGIGDAFKNITVKNSK
jgi:cytochrome c556